MEVRKKRQAIRHVNTAECIAYEYEFQTSEIDMALIELSGRYPAEGWAVNSVCTSLIYVTKGEGELLGPAMNKTLLESGDQILISKDELYAFEGHMGLIFAAHPAWTPEQADVVK